MRMERPGTRRKSTRRARVWKPKFLQAPQRQAGRSAVCTWQSDRVRRIPVRTSPGEWFVYLSSPFAIRGQTTSEESLEATSFYSHADLSQGRFAARRSHVAVPLDVV